MNAIVQRSPLRYVAAVYNLARKPEQSQVHQQPMSTHDCLGFRFHSRIFNPTAADLTSQLKEKYHDEKKGPLAILQGVHWPLYGLQPNTGRLPSASLPHLHQPPIHEPYAPKKILSGFKFTEKLRQHVDGVGLSTSSEETEAIAKLYVAHSAVPPHSTPELCASSRQRPSAERLRDAGQQQQHQQEEEEQAEEETIEVKDDDVHG